MVYKPAAKRGLFTAITDTGDRTGFGGWPEYRNSYKNTLLWNVGEYFRIFLGKSNLKNAVVIYTADHGQDLHEDGSPGYGTHCRTSPSYYEGLVPMVVITENAEWKNKVEKWSHSNFGQTSHYRIFPTLLQLMGYSAGPIKRDYGFSLFEPGDDPMTFNARFNAKFGSTGTWKKIKTEEP